MRRISKIERNLNEALRKYDVIRRAPLGLDPWGETIEVPPESDECKNCERRKLCELLRDK